MEITPNYSVIETWRKKSELTQEDLCSRSDISVRRYRSMIKGELTKQTPAIASAIQNMANILSPDDTAAFLRDVYGVGNVQPIIDDINAAIPHSPLFVSAVTPLFLETGNPINCSEIISMFTAVMCGTYSQLPLSTRHHVAGPFLTEMACELSMCSLETNQHTLEGIYTSIISNLSILSDNGIPASEVTPVLDMLRLGRIHNSPTERLEAIRAAFFAIYDHFYSINSPDGTLALCEALSDISILCTDYTCSAPDTFSLGFAIYEYCTELLSNQNEVDNA